MQEDTILLVDDWTVAETRGLAQRFFPLTKSPANPVIVKTEPWEGEGPYLWGNRIIRNPDTGQYQLWYTGYRHADNHYRWGYAVSDDGLTWEKPPLFIETFEGRPARNMPSVSSRPDKAACSVARDPRPDCDPARRYCGIHFTYGGELVCFSPDGVHWTEYPGNPVWHVPSDIIHAIWDPRRGRFVAFYKVWEVRGRRADPSRADFGEPFIGYAPTFDPRPGPPGCVDVTGPFITFHPESRAEVAPLTVRLAAGGQGRDDGGGSCLSGAWTGKRVQCFAESDDFIHWEHERLVLRADERDDPTANIQFMFVFLYGGYYVAVLNLHDESGLFHHQLAFSRDGLEWTRPWRGKFLEVGPPGSFDAGMVLGPADPILIGDRLLFYYGGCRMPHYEMDYARYHPAMAIGVATLRRDGLAAWEAGGDTGELLTQPVRCEGEHLLVNADARNGAVEVEIADESGRPIPGFERRNCEPIRCDSTGAEARWRGKARLAELVGRAVRVRFALRQASLYAFRFERHRLTRDLADPSE